jgi:mRNA interferase RelE/StbE
MSSGIRRPRVVPGEMSLDAADKVCDVIAEFYGKKLTAVAEIASTMKYEIEIKEEAKVELRELPGAVRREIGYRLHLLQREFSGDVKKLKGSRNEYRLRVGNYRVLFELVGKRIVVYTLGQRKDIYR